MLNRINYIFTIRIILGIFTPYWIKMETVKGYEHSNKRICKYGIQREDCRKCLFDNLCTPEDKAQDKNKGTSKNKNQYAIA